MHVETHTVIDCSLLIVRVKNQYPRLRYRNDLAAGRFLSRSTWTVRTLSHFVDYSNSASLSNSDFFFRCWIDCPQACYSFTVPSRLPAVPSTSVDTSPRHPLFQSRKGCLLKKPPSRRRRLSSAVQVTILRLES